MVGGISGHMEEADKAANGFDVLRLGGFTFVVASHGDMKAASIGASVEQVGSSSFKQKLLEEGIDNALAFIDIVTSGSENQ